jgi:plastocyanin domain-containing protein
MRVAFAAALVLMACQANESRAPLPASARSDVTIRISGGTYTPSSVQVQKGQPVRLHFTRDEKPTCGDELVFPALDIKRKVEVNKLTTVEITPQQRGELEFTCGMSMMKGKIVVQ